MTSGNAAMRTTGRVKFFNEAKGFGFIIRDDGSGDVFVHRTDLPAEVNFLYEGQAVTFDPDLVRAALEPARQSAALARQSGTIGPELPVAADASDLTRLLAIFGRAEQPGKGQ